MVLQPRHGGNKQLDGIGGIRPAHEGGGGVIVDVSVFRAIQGGGVQPLFQLRHVLLSLVVLAIGGGVPAALVQAGFQGEQGGIFPGGPVGVRQRTGQKILSHGADIHGAAHGDADEKQIAYQKAENHPFLVQHLAKNEFQHAVNLTL